MAKATVEGKAARLWVRGQVNILQQGEAYVVARVKGDHGTYLLRLPEAEASCTCPWFTFQGWRKPCSHIEAVREEMNPIIAA